MKLWISSIICSLTIFSFGKPSYGFVPLFYKPDFEELKKTSLNIGKTASQLIYFGQTKEAIRLSKLAIRLNPKEERLWLILAEAQIRNNLLEEANLSIDKAKDINPKKANIWFAKASISMQQKNPNNAIKFLNKGINIDNKNSNAFFQLGNARFMKGQFKLAINAFEEALSIKPKLWQALNNKALALYELKKDKQAINIWREVLEIENDPEPMLALAAALYKLEINNKESFLLAEQALTRNPNYISREHQEDQLWGKRLQQAAEKLLKNPKLKKSVLKALANSTLNDD